MSAHFMLPHPALRPYFKACFRLGANDATPSICNGSPTGNRFLMLYKGALVTTLRPDGSLYILPQAGFGRQLSFRRRLVRHSSVEITGVDLLH